MRLAAVESAAFEHRPGFDQQHRLVGIVQKVRPELVSEAPPPGRFVTHGSATKLMATKTVRASICGQGRHGLA